jgi:uncharacterized membrane protein
MTERPLRAGIAALALAGAGVAAYLTYARYSGSVIACSTGGCETVQSSSYAKVAGVPVAVLGLAGYLGLLATAIARGELARAAGAAVAFSAFGFSAYLLYAQLALIDAVCDWCLVSDAIVTVAAALALLRFLAGHVVAPTAQLRGSP